MKRIFKFIAIIVIALMLLPLTVVNAASKAETVIEKLKEDEYFKSINGKVTYENETIEIEYSLPNNTYNEVSFPYNGDVIEFSSGEITNYEEAVSAISYMLYATTLQQTALILNGYTAEQIKTFFESNDSNLDYDINGMEIKLLEEAKQYVSKDGSETVTAAPFSIKIDVKKANLNTSSADPIPSTTTIEDFVKYLEEDESFRIHKDDEDKVIAETDIEKDDDNITISTTSYNYNYYWVSLPCENDIMTYEVPEVADYEEASEATSHISFATTLLQIALELNGYTDEEIQSFFSSADSKLDYDINGIEYKILGEGQEFSDGEGSTISVTPISIKVDFAKANLNKLTEDNKVLEDENETYTIEEETATTDTNKTEKAKPETEIKNPKTGDNIIMTISIFAIATLGAYTTLKVNRNPKMRKH